MNQYKNISMSDSNDTSIDLKSNEASFLQRQVELNLKRNTSLIVYTLYTFVTVIILARMAGCNNS